jgi:hypothetical protein
MKNWKCRIFGHRFRYYQVPLKPPYRAARMCLRCGCVEVSTLVFTGLVRDPHSFINVENIGK